MSLEGLRDWGTLTAGCDSVDAEIVKDATKCKMDLPGGLQRTLHGTVKPSMYLRTCFSTLLLSYIYIPAILHLHLNLYYTVPTLLLSLYFYPLPLLPSTQSCYLTLTSQVITQCSIRHLYSLSPADHPHKDASINLAKTFERRRCNHHELPEPLSERECMESVIVHNGENKHRYCVATQAPEIRQDLRAVPGVPLVYINRSVMIMEPMAPISAIKREREERGKFRAGIKETRPKAVKRKREDGEDGEGEGGEGGEEGEEKKKKKKRKGPKGPNPLSVKKKKKVEKPSGEGVKPREAGAEGKDEVKVEGEGGGDGQSKRKRKRKHGTGKAGVEKGAAAAGESTAIEVDS